MKNPSRADAPARRHRRSGSGTVAPLARAREIAFDLFELTALLAVFAYLGWRARGSTAIDVGMIVAYGAILVLFALALGRNGGAAARSARLNQALRRISRHGMAAIPSAANATRESTQPFQQASRRIGLSVAAHAALLHIDKEILASMDLDVIAQSAIRLLRGVTGARSIVVVLDDVPSAARALVYGIRSDKPDRIERMETVSNNAWSDRLPPAPVLHWQGVLPVPDAATGILESWKFDPAPAVFPIPGTRKVRGVILLGFPRAPHLTEEQRDLVGDLVGRLRMTCRMVEHNRNIKELAHLDALTGLLNRRALLPTLRAALAAAAARKTQGAVLLLDLDRFKVINDTLGHAAGDGILRAAAERIRKNLRESDVVARHGGDEFVIVLTDLPDVRDAGSVARQLIAALSKRFDIDGKPVYIGASVGIAAYPSAGSAPEELLRKADTAMYRAKENGRNRYAYFDEGMAAEARNRATLEADLRGALAHGGFLLHFQPLVDLETGGIFAVEALLRWQHPVRGLLAPDAFLPFAETVGLIDAIGTWVLIEACEQHRRWRTAGVPIPRVAVNVSTAQLRRSHFVGTVIAALQTTGMPRGALELEITESMDLHGDAAVKDALNRLAAVGVTFAIDDFGTGYSSFSNLLGVPAHIVKLDRSFVHGAVGERDRSAILAALITMSHALDKKVVAEGVEGSEQIELLRSLGCDIVQGFHLCRPGTATQVAAYAQRRPDTTAPQWDTSGASILEAAASLEASRRDDDEWLTVPLIDA